MMRFPKARSNDRDITSGLCGSVYAVLDRVTVPQENERWQILRSGYSSYLLRPPRCKEVKKGRQARGRSSRHSETLLSGTISPKTRGFAMVRYRDTFLFVVHPSVAA